MPALLFFVIIFSGCSNATSDEASPETRRALTILGSNDQSSDDQSSGAGIVGGLRALDGVENFLAAVDARLASQSQDRLYELLENLGIDPATESLSIYISIADLHSNEMPKVVIFAPLSEIQFESLMENVAELEHVEIQRSGNSFSFRDSRRDEAVYLSLIENGLLLVAASESDMEEMHARAHRANEESQNEQGSEQENRQRQNISRLTAMASQGQFWISSESIQQIISVIPIQTSNQNFELLTKAVAGAAMSFDIHEKGQEGPAVTASLWLSPREGIEADDLVDLAAGLVAFGRVKGEELPELRAFVDLLEISEDNGTARIAIEISASDIGGLLIGARNLEMAN